MKLPDGKIILRIHFDTIHKCEGQKVKRVDRFNLLLSTVLLWGHIITYWLCLHLESKESTVNSNEPWPLSANQRRPTATPTSAHIHARSECTHWLRTKEDKNQLALWWLPRNLVHASWNASCTSSPPSIPCDMNVWRNRRWLSCIGVSAIVLLNKSTTQSQQQVSKQTYNTKCRDVEPSLNFWSSKPIWIWIANIQYFQSFIFIFTQTAKKHHDWCRVRSSERPQTGRHRPLCRPRPRLQTARCCVIRVNVYMHVMHRNWFPMYVYQFLSISGGWKLPTLRKHSMCLIPTVICGDMGHIFRLRIGTSKLIRYR